MSIRELLIKLSGISNETVMYAQTPYRIYRVAKCKTLKRELGRLSDEEKDGEDFTTKYDGVVSDWTAGQIGTKEEFADVS